MGYYGRATFVPMQDICCVCEKVRTERIYVRDWEGLPKMQFHICSILCEKPFLVWEAKQQFNAGEYLAWNYIKNLKDLKFTRSSGKKQIGQVRALNGAFVVVVRNDVLALPLSFHDGAYTKDVPLIELVRLNNLPPFTLEIPTYFNADQARVLQKMIVAVG